MAANGHKRSFVGPIEMATLDEYQELPIALSLRLLPAVDLPIVDKDFAH